MAYYLQLMTFDRSRPQLPARFEYMGSAEFEWGSFPTIMQIMRAAPVIVHPMKGYFAIDRIDDNKHKNANLVMITLDGKLDDENTYLNLAMADWDLNMRKAYGLNGTERVRFKEPSYLEYNVGMTKRAEMSPSDINNIYSSRHVWIAVDYGVHNRARDGWQDSEVGKERHDMHVANTRRAFLDPERMSPSPIYIVCHSGDVDHILERFELRRKLKTMTFKEEDIRMFDIVGFHEKGSTQHGKIVGILPDVFRVEANGKRTNVKFVDITEHRPKVTKSERA